MAMVQNSLLLVLLVSWMHLTVAPLPDGGCRHGNKHWCEQHCEGLDGPVRVNAINCLPDSWDETVQNVLEGCTDPNSSINYNLYLDVMTDTGYDTTPITSGSQQETCADICDDCVDCVADAGTTVICPTSGQNNGGTLTSGGCVTHGKVWINPVTASHADLCRFVGGSLALKCACRSDLCALHSLLVYLSNVDAYMHWK